MAEATMDFFREARAALWDDVRELGAGFALLGLKIWKLRAELLHIGAVVFGWGFLTWGIASLLVPQVWPISLGLFLLSLAGWGHLRVLFTSGVYALHNRPRK